jgi:hypothetical protein
MREVLLWLLRHESLSIHRNLPCSLQSCTSVRARAQQISGACSLFLLVTASSSFNCSVAWSLVACAYTRLKLCSLRSRGNDSLEQTSTRRSIWTSGDIPEGRAPGLLPFTTVPYTEPLADQLYDSALIHGWLSCMDAKNTKRRERWCALNDAMQSISCNAIH